MSRYLRRDNILISSIKRLAELAKIGREALMNGELDELGGMLLEAWRLHQELDPFCSNRLVDELFAFADPLLLRLQASWSRWRWLCVAACQERDLRQRT